VKKAFCSVVFTLVLVGGACAGIQAVESQMAVSLPQPPTILICAAGLAFLRLTLKRVS
jgi:hypothetical protein